MRLRPIILLAVLCAALTACQRESPAIIEGGPVDVGVRVGSSEGVGISITAGTKTFASGDGLSTQWSTSDNIALWALDGGGNAVLNAQPFSVYSVSGSSSYFTSTLSSPMPEGQYSYFASYPLPEQVSGGIARYTIPDKQDGVCGSGAEPLFSNVAVAGALHAIDWNEGHDDSDLCLDMSSLVHRLRFYLPEVSGLEGESIEEMMVSFPRAVAGKFDVNLASVGIGSPVPAGVLNGAGENTVNVFPVEPVSMSTSSEKHYVNVAIAPTSFSDGEYMDVTIHTQSKILYATIPLMSRTFAAGHSTAAGIVPSSIVECRRLFFTLASNPVGEDIQSIRLTAPTGSNWGSSGSNIFDFTPSELIKTGDRFCVEFLDLAQFESFSGKDIQVTYESDHLTINQTVHIGSLTGKVSENLGLNVPWLLNEDFNDVQTFSSNDEYATSKAGSYSSYSFLDGWAGARVGAEAGKCIRIACRRETSARYDSRVDSAPLNAVFKKPTNLVVEFDYGADNRYGGIPIVLDGNVGQNCHLGYITTTKNYKSGDKDGTYQHNFYIKEYSGSFDSTPNNDSFVLQNVPAGNIVRISWRTVVEDQAGLTNTTAWFYIDNVKVKIYN